MKLYTHKHIAFDQETWEIIENYMKNIGIDNFTKLVKETLMKEINLTQTN